jgi:hypothetical protein
MCALRSKEMGDAVSNDITRPSGPPPLVPLVSQSSVPLAVLFALTFKKYMLKKLGWSKMLN